MSTKIFSFHILINHLVLWLNFCELSKKTLTIFYGINRERKITFDLKHNHTPFIEKLSMVQKRGKTHMHVLLSKVILS